MGVALVGVIGITSLFAFGGSAPSAAPDADRGMAAPSTTEIPVARSDGTTGVRAVALLRLAGDDTAADAVEALLAEGDLTNEVAQALSDLVDSLAFGTDSPEWEAALELVDEVVRPPGLDDDQVPPGQGGTPPGQDPEWTPPGEDPDFVPPGQDPAFVPPGQEDKDTPPGQADKDTPPGQAKKSEGGDSE